jgi:hypothetical protein
MRSFRSIEESAGFSGVGAECFEECCEGRGGGSTTVQPPRNGIEAAATHSIP